MHSIFEERNRKMQKGSVSLVLAACFLLASCALPQYTIPPNPSNPIETVAVLPMYNATNDVGAAEMVREMTNERIKRWHYTSKPLNEVDQILLDQMGVTLGDQLELTTPQKLGAALGVDAVLYGYLVDFGEVVTGLYNEKRVRAGYRLVETKTGKVFWSGGRGVRNSSGALESAAGARDEGIDSMKDVKGVAEIPGIKEWDAIGGASDPNVLKAFGAEAFSKMRGAHLKSETAQMLDRIFGDLPAGRGTAEAEPSPVKLPEIAAPPPPPVPYMGFMRAQKDFTADLVVTSVLKKQNRNMVIHGKLAKGGNNFRTDMDMSEAMGEEAKGMPAGLNKTAMIWQGGDQNQKNFTLYPDLKKYIENKVVDDKADEPKMTRKKVGEEVVDGHKCDKVQVEMTAKDGKTHQGLMWEAKDLGGFVIKSEFEDGDAKQTMEMKNVKLGAPPASLFEVPKDYTKATGFMDLMSGQE
jgi:hypothetical protein